MKSTRRLIINTVYSIVLSFVCTVGFAQKVYTIDDVPNVHLQDREAYVSDPEHKLSAEDVKELNAILRFFDDSLAVQCATIVLPAIDAEPSEFAHDLFNKWGIGDKETDRGLLILLVYGDGEGTQRDIYMATGYGLEGDLPDALCKYIQTETMVPLLKEEKFGEGLIAGVREAKLLLENEEEKSKLMQQIEEQETKDTILGLSIIGSIGFIFFLIIGFIRVMSFKNEKNPYKRYKDDTSLVSWQTLGCMSIVFFPIAILYFIIMWFVKRKYVYNCLRCKKCGSSNIGKPTYEHVRKATRFESGLDRYSFLCKDCGHVHIEEELIKYVSSTYSSSGGSSSSSSSSSSSGGSWGGGSSGGGGAGTSF